MWRYEKRKNRRDEWKETKVPYSPYAGPAKSNDPSTWASFDYCLEAALHFGMDGIGFQFGGTEYTGIDLDFKKYPGEDIPPEAVEIIEQFDSYTEMTPSGKGVHIIVRGKLPPNTRRKVVLSEFCEMEVYSEGRFFTMSGDVIQSPYIVSAQEALQALSDRWLVRQVAEKIQEPSRPLYVSAIGNDDELLTRMFRSANGSKAQALFDGDLTLHGGDHSTADSALCMILAFWCNGDKDQMDRLFRRSGLMRPKWDAKHRDDGSTYGQMTLEAVLDAWNGNGYAPKKKPVSDPDTPSVTWDSPEVLMKGQQHLTSTGASPKTADSYSKLWLAVLIVLNQGGFTVRQGDTIRFTPAGMTEIYAHAGGRPMDRRQQLQFLHSQGLTGGVVRQDPDNFKSPLVLEMPANPQHLPMWAMPRGSLPQAAD